jgi:hypothetical protein
MPGLYIQERRVFPVTVCVVPRGTLEPVTELFANAPGEFKVREWDRQLRVK